LGRSYYIERLYSLFMAVCDAVLISSIWKLIFRDKPEHKKLSWLPVLFWIIIPVCFYSIINNLVETTMSLFVLASVYFAMKAMEKKRVILFLMLSGLMVFLS